MPRAARLMMHVRRHVHAHRHAAGRRTQFDEKRHAARRQPCQKLSLTARGNGIFPTLERQTIGTTQNAGVLDSNAALYAGSLQPPRLR
jgi:hypothetical protein